MLGKKTSAGAVVAGTLALLVPSAAAGAVTLGSNLATEPGGNTSCSSALTDRGCLAIDDVLPEGELVAPFDGVIVGWRVRLGEQTDAQQIRIRTVRRVDDDQFTALTTGELEQVAEGSGTYTFPARIPIRAGDQVGLEADQNATIVWRADLLGANSFEYNPTPANGTDTDPPVFTNPDEEHTFNVDVEPDADGDGFGDESQDGCPGDVFTQADCIAPETTITKDAPKKTDKSKVKLKFVSSELDSTFQCKLKVKPSVGKHHTRPAKFKACESPRKLKNLGTGEYKFKVRAIDAAGNVDPSPAKDKFKVVD